MPPINWGRIKPTAKTTNKQINNNQNQFGESFAFIVGISIILTIFLFFSSRTIFVILFGYFLLSFYLRSI